MKKMMEFVVVLVQKGRNCALASKNKDSFLLRFTVWGCMQENSMLFILDIITSLTQITGRGGAGVPCCGLIFLCCGLKAKGVHTQSETGNTANDISRKSRNMYLVP